MAPVTGSNPVQVLNFFRLFAQYTPFDVQTYNQVYFGVKGHLNALFSLILRLFKHLRAFQLKHISSTPKLFNFSSCHSLICITQSKKTSNKANETEHRLCRRGYPLRSFKKYWLKLSSPTEMRLFAIKQNKQKRFYRLLLSTIRPHWISKRILWNTGTSFNSNISLNKSLPSHRLSPTGRKNLLTTF